MTFLSVPKQGYFVELNTGRVTSSKHLHSFCGSHEVDGAWCPNCDKPLLRFLALDAGDKRLELPLAPHGTVSLFFCWTCNIAQSYPFLYAIQGEGSIRLLQYGRGGAIRDFPYEDYPVHFPLAEAHLVQIPEADQRVIRQINTDEVDWNALHPKYQELDKPRHQVGGEPYLVQRDRSYRMRCSMCAQPMPFLAAIADSCLDKRGFTGNPYVQVLFHYCRRCTVVGAFQQCD